MKLRNFLLASICCVVFSLLSGCSFSFLSADDLMRPPLPYGGNLGFQEAFEKAVGTDVILKTPSSGDHRSAFVLYDIDADGEEEALVFYTLRSDKTTVRMNVLDKINDQWLSVWDTAGAGSSVNKISFTDMNGDGVPEIIINWDLFESTSNKILSIYECFPSESGVTIKVLSNEAFSAMEILDVDDDGHNEVFIVFLDSSANKPQAFARILKMKENGAVYLAGETQLDASVAGYTSLKKDKVNDESPLRIYIDATRGDVQMITEVVYWDKQAKKLVSPLFNTETQSAVSTWRAVRLTSRDINNDGIIEIPTQTLLPGSKRTELNVLNNTDVYLTCWSRLNGRNLEPVMYSAVNIVDGYMFAFPEKWIDKITIYYDVKQHRWDFYEWDSKKNIRGEKLFGIVSVEFNEWSKNPISGYTAIIAKEDLVHSYTLTPAGEKFGITKDFLLTNFSLIDL